MLCLMLRSTLNAVKHACDASANAGKTVLGACLGFMMTGVLGLGLGLGLGVSLGVGSVSAQTPALDTNDLKEVRASRSGDDTVVSFTLSKPWLGNVPSFLLANPARLVVDFPRTNNEVAKSAVDASVGEVRNVMLAQSGDKTRAVVSLNRSSTYKISTVGSQVVVTFSSATGAAQGSSGATVTAPASNAMVRFAPSPTLTPSIAANSKEIKNIDFRRGDDGSGRLIVDMIEGSPPINVRQQGGRLLLDIDNTQLPNSLRRRLDVADFATPVQRVSAEMVGANTRLTIEPKGPFEHAAYQTDSRVVIEVRAIKEDPNKLIQGAKSGYKGDKLSLNFQNIEVRSLLQVFADFTNLNIITSDTVQGSITLRLKDVPWDQALDIVMQAKNLDSRKNGNVVLIAPRDELAAKEKVELERQSQITALEPVRSEVFQLQYQRAEDIKKMLTETNNNGGGSGVSGQTIIVSRFLSPRGSASSDTRTNQLFVTDVTSKLEEIRKLLSKVDIPIRQVIIEARIVEADDRFGRNLGVKLGFKNTSGDSTGLGVTGGTSIGSSNFVNLPASSLGGASPAAFGLSLFSAGLTRFINLELSALEADNKGKIVSSPRVVTSDSVKATIQSGTEIPYVTTSSSGSTTTFKKAVLKLEVTPQITPEGNVIMDVEINKDSRGEVTPNAGFAIDTKQIKTQVLVENGGTVVIGGIYTQEESNLTSKVPLLGDVPILGNLFKSNQKVNNRSELLIFLTPRLIINNNLNNALSIQ
jgi:type IV pilus assembly protein PilQ